jgi:hypothetical protein
VYAKEDGSEFENAKQIECYQSMPASPRTQEKDCHCKVVNIIQMSEDRLAGAQVPTTRISSSFKILRLDYLPLS